MLISHQPRANRTTNRITRKRSRLPLDLAVRVCDNVNMKPRIAAICTIVVFATCGGHALAQFPDCAHTSTEGQAKCQPPAQAVYVVNDRTNGQVEVTVRATLLIDRLPGTTGSMDQVLTLAAGERRELGCLVYPPKTRTTWDLVDCHSL